MASNTENLNLLMKNPSTDGADTFNVQTMLNENWQKIDNNAGTVAQTLANILKPTTPPIIGLPSSTTPDGMFQALGNTGELHVWRKTVVTTEPVQAGYTIGEKISLSNNRAVLLNGNGADTISVSSSISVDENSGKVTLGDSIVYSIWNTTANIQGPNNQIPVTELAGKYFVINKGVSYPNIPSNLAYDTVYYIPQNATCGYDYNWVTLTDLRLVNGHPYIPAGTTTTYPVSTNPNAYQEGSDAKPAGYTLGEVVTGKVLASKCYNNTAIYYGKSVSVSDNGIVSILNPTTRTLSSTLSSAEIASIKDSFVYFSGNENYSDVSSAFRYGNIVYIPTDASVSTEYANSAYGVYIDRYQPVTGYAAIPAGTTIEYLGKLGDKARVQVVSYVGTGTYGDSNQCSITAGFKIKAAIMMYHYIPSAGSIFMISDELSTDYTSAIGFSKDNANYSWGKKSADGKTLFWYGTRSGNGQFNESGKTYYVLCIG